MIGSRRPLAVLVIASNLAIPLGTLTFRWSPLTVVALFVADLLIGVFRMLLERSFAARPPGNETHPQYRPVPWNAYSKEKIYEGLLAKRGAVRFVDWVPAIYPRNLPYVVGCQLSLAPLLILVATWVLLPSPTGSLDSTALIALILIMCRHILIILTWRSTGRYEQASPATIRRHREFLFSALVACFAVIWIGSQPNNIWFLVADSTVVLIPKLIFDFRDAGLGPSFLTFDSSTDTEDSPINMPDETPRYVSKTQTRAIFGRALGTAAFHLFFPGLTILLIITVIGFVVDSVFILIVLTAAVVAIVFGLDTTALWFAYGNVEYRVYDGALVAYDQYLDEPQWRLEVTEVVESKTDPKREENALFPGTSHKKNYINGLLPYMDSPVVIERRESEDAVLEYLDRPEDFAQAIREWGRERQTHRV